MYTKFEALNEEKKTRIINASFDEFSNKTFKEASTEEIAKNAGISKGALFQYFGTKKQLYLYVSHYGYQLLEKEIWEGVDFENGDFLERLRQISKVKMNLVRRYPNISEFIMFSYTRETDEAIISEINQHIAAKTAETYQKIYAGIDYSLFKPEFNPAHIISIITWTLEGYSNVEIAKLKNSKASIEIFENWVAELDQYIDTLKKAFYKEENKHG